MNSVYVHRISANELHIYQRARYRGTDPQLPLWQVYIARNNHLSSSLFKQITPEWKIVSTFLTHVLPVVDNESTWVVYTRANWSTTGTWSNLTGHSTVDNETSSAVNLFTRTTTINDYATLTFTVPEGWDGATVDAAFYFNIASGHGVANDTKVELFRNDVPVPLNGRGTVWSSNETTSILSRRGLRCWRSDGVWDSHASSGSQQNVVFELARGLKPGTYQLRVTKTADTAGIVSVGRVRVRRGIGCNPGDANWKKYIEEYNIVDADGYGPGPFTRSWGGSNYVAIRSNLANSQFSGGSAHGGTYQLAHEWRGDGQVVTFGSDDTVYGPYDELRLVATNRYHRAIGGQSNHTCNATANSATLSSMGAGVDLTAIAAGDYICLNDRTTTGGTAPRDFGTFVVEAVDVGAGTITLTTAVSANSTAKIFVVFKGAHPLLEVEEHYIFRDRVLTLEMAGTWGTGVESANGGLRLSYIPMHEVSNSSATRPHHPQGLRPYDATHNIYVGPGHNILVNPMTDAPAYPLPAHVDFGGQDARQIVTLLRNIEGRERREVGRILVFELDPADYVGADLSEANTKRVHTNAGVAKSYAAIHDSSSPARTAGGPFAAKARYYWAEEGYLTLTGNKLMQPILSAVGVSDMIEI